MGKTRKDFLPAAEAAQMLGIRRQTLYAYVSRGLVRSIANGRQRERHYAREDLERIAARSRGQGTPGAASVAPAPGQPAMATGITTVTPEGPVYRGRPALDLVRQGASFEQVAELLWTGLWHETARPWLQAGSGSDLESSLSRLPASAGRQQLPELFALVVMQLAMGRGQLQERLVSGRPLEAAREVIASLAGCFGLLSAPGRYRRIRPGLPLAQALLESLGAGATPQDAALLNAALVLLADEALSPATCAARMAASAGASLHSCIAAAMATASGLDAGRGYEKIGNFLKQAPRGRSLAATALAQAASGQGVSGFSDPLYPGGDARAACLLGLVAARGNKPASVKAMLDLAGQLKAAHGLHPGHEFAVLAMCKALKLPADAAAALTVLARTAGWVAHILEQRLSGSMAQPRAHIAPSAAAAIPKPEIEPDVAGRLNVVWDESSPNGRMAHLVKDAARSFLRSLQARLAMENVTLGHWTFLRILWDKDGITQRELSYEAGVMEPTTVVALRAMEGLGYVTRERRGENRKSFYVFLTPLGRSLQLRLVPLAEEVNALAVFGLAPDHVTTTRRSLQLMLDNLASDPLLAAEAAPPQML